MTVGFIGLGKMADAVLGGLLTAGLVEPWQVTACEKVPARRDEIAKLRKIIFVETAAEVVKHAQVVVLAVKPQDLEGVLAEIKPALKASTLIVSIAAGKTLGYLQKQLGPTVRIARVMPNLPLTVGLGMSAFCLGKAAKATDKTTVRKMLACAGEVAELPEKQFDAVTALSGSGPAFFTYVLMGLTTAAVKAGLDKKLAPLFAVQTMLGTSMVLLETGIAPNDFIKAVASPKGTTEAGLNVLKASDIAAVLANTIKAAADRSRELRG